MRRLVAVVVAALVVAACSGWTSPSTPPTSPAGSAVAATATPTAAQPTAAATAPFSRSTATTPTAAPSGSAALDGDWLLFEWYAPGKNVKDVMVVRPDGSERRVLATDIEPGLEHADATWSPDGATIAFVVGDWYDGASIWTVPIDGHGAKKLIGPDDRCRLGVAFPSYSPDGRRLMYSCQDGTSGTSPDVHETLAILDLASGERASVVTLRGRDELVWPTWSRDGTTSVFTVNTWAPDLTTQTGSYIATVPIAGGPIKPLMDADTWATDGRWSPTDDRIVYATHGYGVKDMSVRSTIETIRSDGTDHRTIWPGTDAADGRVGAPHWTPDGGHLVVSVATGSDKISDIHPASLTLDGRLETIPALTGGVGFTPRPMP